ncbi:hypothetical protein CRE_15133 [Caenorhabditis remanei]|uniref:Sdz-33 F-box domain-containing protein n=1 Tax=Caenorhabditis remanei TaxID=31234 RepID=E3NRI3_CAERE|nr:hypothetical protein CRE_15133 [Caenorhabditis remanei]
MFSFRINFSMTSKRSKAVTKKMTLYSKYHIFVTINNALEITIRGINNFVTCTYEMTSDKQMDGKTEEMTYKDRIFRNVYNYAEDLVEGWKQLCKHVLDIFKRKTIDGIGMTMDEFVDHNVSVIDFLKTNEIVVNGCYLYQNRRKKNVDKHVAYFLKNLTVNLNFTLHLNIRNNNFDGKIPKRLHLLNIEPSKWIGYERLLKIDSKHVILRNNRITNEQWNLFLKKWVSMETNQNLEYMELDKRELGGFRDRVLYDIPHEVVSEEVSRILTM